ncbi:hypothetical protein K0M31_000910 [Melipona bicolor]|uniref:Uncharacterized protein n=1 Tax=Melipona bicolor TaxID=60889 RepID=A0AA40GEN6_9HYME|nr:hypothetical protein K0M31_000910 [Melipona bicolor]
MSTESVHIGKPICTALPASTPTIHNSKWFKWTAEVELVSSFVLAESAPTSFSWHS